MRFRLLPKNFPPYWRCITNKHGLESYIQKRDWQLVLNSQNIPYKIISVGNSAHIYVPPLLEQRARKELAAYIRENKRKPEKHWPAHKNPWLIILFLLPLILFHGMREGWWPSPPAWPKPETWLASGSLDSANIKIWHQWQRAFTALTLHANVRHISGNILFGAIFLSLLARSIGIGRALLSAILAGAMGNLISIYLHTGNYRSIGFSTAIFATVGILGGLMFLRTADKRRMFLPLAAASGLLALLGTEGETTDYAAHLSGLICGIFFGILQGLAEKYHLPQLPQTLAGLLAITIIATAWTLAFNQ